MKLNYEFYVAAPPETIWNILVTPEGTRQIFFGCVLESTFEPGADYAYVGPGNDGDRTVHVYGKWLEFEPYRLMSCTEHPGPSYTPNHAEQESRMTFTLEPVGNCTKMTLVNDAFSPDHPGIQKASDSWWMILSNIKTLAETGKTLDLGW
jgi:uncharacterized protein YndB with AHSA1/START domain